MIIFKTAYILYSLTDTNDKEREKITKWVDENLKKSKVVSKHWIFIEFNEEAAFILRWF